MSAPTISAPPVAAALAHPASNPAGAPLFFATFLFVFVSLTPFPDLSVPGGGAGSAFNQLLALTLLAGALLHLWHTQSLGLAVRPRFWIGLVFAWIAVAALSGFDPTLSLRRLVMAGLVCVAAAAMLHYPKTEDQFARWLGAGTLMVLALSWLGVIVLPGRAIHQAGDYLEPFLAGDWRGHFGHKNTAASVMALFVFVGLYLNTRGARRTGTVILGLAAVFLWFSGGKTALGLVPVALGLAFLLERRPRLGTLGLFATMAVIAAGTMGIVFWPELEPRLAVLGVETTFTGRMDIWALAVEYIAREPVWGYGYQMFWQRPDLQYGFRETFTWATMAVDAHNGYLDIALSAGLPAIGLLLVWILVLPLRDLGTMKATVRRAPLTRLYVRVWLFVLLLGFLETTFVTSAGPTWFLMLMAMFGMRLQARAALVERDPAREAPRDARRGETGHGSIRPTDENSYAH